VIPRGDVLMAKVCVETYGCTLNQADSDIIMAILKERHSLVEDWKKSDVVVINSCTVKGATENRIFERMRTLRKEGKAFVIAGCLTANAAKIRKYAPAAPLVGTSSLRHISDAVDDALAGRATSYNANEAKDALPKLLTAPIMRIPINDGCTSQCHFCQTKLARPYLRSYTPKTILKWIGTAVENGAKEIQLTSMDSGAYGLDIKTTLVSLLRLIAESDFGEKKFFVRVGMINPNHAKRMLPELVEILQGPRFYRFLHIPVQTGSEKVCREMNRDHSVKDFIDIVRAVRKAMPDATIATDIIVGYPTETRADFAKTLELLETVRPDITNVSKFSPRPGTKAMELSQLANGEVKRRSTVASEEVKKTSMERKKLYVGRACRVLVTERQRDFTGRDINYHQVVVKGFKGPLGAFVDVTVASANHGSLFGKMA